MTIRLDKELRRACEERVRALDLPAPFDIRAFCRRLGADRGRPLYLMPATLRAPTPCGLWVALPNADYVVYETRTVSLHQEHIILHEVGHLLCDHGSVPVLEEEAGHLLLPHFDASVVIERLRGRTTYSAQEEQEAEYLASLILEQAGRTVPAAVRIVPADAAAVLRRMRSTLEAPSEVNP
jgi:hypothetical protein